MTMEQLLERMAALLHQGGRWQARATGSRMFHVGDTPREAMERALGLQQPDSGRRRARFD